MVLDVSDTIVLCFILLLASLALATINPTMVGQELQVAVARVTVVRPHRHHYSSRPGQLLPPAPPLLLEVPLASLAEPCAAFTSAEREKTEKNSKKTAKQTTSDRKGKRL